MASKLCLSILAIILYNGIYFGEVHAQFTEGACRTPERAMGNCINLKQCRPLLNLLMSRPIPPENRDYLQRSQCGFEGRDPKVCCPVTSPNPTGVNLPPETATPNQPIQPTRRPVITATRSSYYREPPPSINGHRNLGLLPNDCGNVEDDKLIGGNKTGLFEFPWMALLSYNTARGIRFQCGGTIINPRYILTAAHCVTNLDRKTLAGVRVGEHNIVTEVDCEEAIPRSECAPEYQDMTVEEVVVHPQYIGGRGGSARYQNDIGLIRLTRDIDMTKENVYPICLPITRELQELATDGTRMVVTGWGATENGTTSNELLKISIPTVDNVQCGRTLNGSVGDGVGFRQMCAGGLRGVDSCGGDSGGPLKYVGRLNNILRYIQHGIVSFGSRNCGREGIPGVYTRVAYYMDWLLDNIKP